MTFSCSICFENLVSSTNPISALACGHTFHKPCINRWINLNSPAQCPLCKKNISKTKIISPLFFSDGNGETAEEESSETTEKIATLEESNRKLKMSIGTLNLEAHEAKEEIALLQTEVFRVRNQRSYIKIIKRVVELDNDLSTQYMQNYLQKVRALPTSDLYVHVGALRARQMRAEREISKKTCLYENKKKENEDLRDQIEQLHDHIRNIESNRPLQGRVSSFRPRVRQRNVVILDSDLEDEDDNEDQNDQFSVGQELAERDVDQSDDLQLGDIRPDEIPEFALLLPETISDDEGFIVEEHVTSTSRRPFKRRSTFIGGDETSSSSRPKKIIKIDLTDDDDA
ncbi:hypothetical protein MFLAVUS_011066 [Mucor flavus]|uniref:RING-type domain-containing protein n=1 Tax=Mucor flavus TaxID=439312 RepID=A0ABP9ZEI8_9FUNG